VALLSVADVKSYMSLSGTTYDGVLGTIVGGVDQEAKRYLGREAVEPTVVGDGVVAEAHAGDRRTRLMLREYPILSVQSVIVNGAPFTPILPFAPGAVALSTAATGGSLAGGQYLYVKVTAYGPLVQNSGVLANSQESGWVSEYSVLVPAGTSTNAVTVTFNRVPNAQYYKVYVGTSPSQQNQYFQVAPTGSWGGPLSPGTESLTITALNGTGSGAPASGALQTGGDYTWWNGGRDGILHRDYGWDAPKASIGWSTSWWDQQGLFPSSTGVGSKVKGPAQQNIVVQYTAGYAASDPRLTAIKHAAVMWAVAMFRRRTKIEVTQEKVHEHTATFMGAMPEEVRLVLNMYKRIGDWQHPRTTQRV